VHEVTVGTETEEVLIPFDTVEQESSELNEGESERLVRGVDGVLTRTFEVEYSDGVETARTLVGEAVTAEPVEEVIAIGTYVPPPEPEPEPEPEPDCDPNYEGACVPIDSDVDCAGGTGDGPSYVQGPVRVIGADIYGLDHDNDGVGCES
jgi:hypothetical protein